MMKRIASIADLHCGHRTGLSTELCHSTDPKWSDFQEDLRGRYDGLVKQFETPDILIVGGDCIDGRGQKSGGTELITSSLSQQVDMAVACIMKWRAKTIVIARGTDYHVGWGGEDWEDIVAERVFNQTAKIYGEEAIRVIIDDHPFINVDGVTFDIKHHIGSTTTPYSGGTAPQKDRMWNEQWWLNNGQPLADVVMRAHSHFCEGAYGHRGSKKWWALRLPALQASGTKYGNKRCSRVVHWGIQYGYVENEKYKFDDFIAEVNNGQVEAIKV